MYLADHPRFARSTRRQTVVLDVAYPREVALWDALEQLLGAEVLHTVVLRLDLVRDTTEVDVRYRVRRAPGREHLPSTAPVRDAIPGARRLQHAVTISEAARVDGARVDGAAR
jgi:hypothetical protein